MDILNEVGIYKDNKFIGKGNSITNETMDQIIHLLVDATKIRISSSRLTKFDYDLPNLEELCFMDSQVEIFIPRQWPKLKYLSISNNKIEHFQTYDWPELEELYIYQNPLKSIDLKLWPKLKTFDAGYCLLESVNLPNWNLTELSIENNPIKDGSGYINNYFSLDMDLIYLFDFGPNALTHYTMLLINYEAIIKIKEEQIANKQKKIKNIQFH